MSDGNAQIVIAFRARVERALKKLDDVPDQTMETAAVILASSRDAIKQHQPGLLPTWERMFRSGDDEAAVGLFVAGACFTVGYAIAQEDADRDE